MNKHLLALGGSVLFASIMLAPTTRAASVYGALYEAGNLVSTNGDSINSESVLMYADGEPGFIAITTNSAGSEWWTSNAAGTVWTQGTTNPLSGYGCTNVGRHSIVKYNGDVYFGAQCMDGDALIARIFKLTGKESAELMYSRDAGTEDFSSYYPTGAVVNDKMYMFYNGGFTQYDGETFADITDAEGQGSSVPLEASAEKDGVVYLPQVDGTVQTFDGTSYTTIGTGYLEDVTDDDGIDHNLPAVAAFNNTVYVGNVGSPATVFEYQAAEGDSEAQWNSIATLEAGNNIVNKMKTMESADAKSYLVFFTANGENGSTIYALDTDNTLTQLVDSGLGKVDPSHNTEVISAIDRTVEYGKQVKHVLLFSTKNALDQTKIFILNVDENLAINAGPKRIISTPSLVDGVSGARASSVDDSTATTAEGEAFQYKIKKSNVEAGAVYSLWINGEKVDHVVGEKDTPVVLTYEGAQDLSAGDTFNVKIGVRHAYGRKEGRIRASNIVKGARLTVTVQ